MSLVMPRRRLFARPLRPFRVERYPGWTDGSDSLSSSETEPLDMEDLLSLADEEAARRWRILSLGYPSHNEGSPFLREAIGSRYRGDGAVNVCAPQEGIFLSAHALLQEGDHVIATVPHYQSLSEVARSIGCTVSAWRPEGSVLRFDTSTLNSLLQPGRTKLVIANWPHNPTGALPTPDELRDVVHACESCGAHLMIDEMYRGLEHVGAEQLSAACDAYERGVSLGGLSKTVGLPGLRVGWLASRDEAFMARVAELKDYISICPPAPSEVLALIALRSYELLLARSRAIVEQGLLATRQMVASHPELLEWSEPRGGTFSFVRIRRADGGEVNTEAYADALRRRANLMLMPGALFDLGDGVQELGNDAAQRVRVTYGRRGTPELLRRWSNDLRMHGVS